MPIPKQCQVFANRIEELQGERENVTGLAGAEKWAALQKNAQIARQILKTKEQLDQCIIQSTPGYETEVVVYDLTGTVVTPVEGRMWRLMPAPPGVIIEAHPTQGGRITFVHVGTIAGSSIGISIHDAPNATFIGPLFRSGAFASLPPGSPGDPAGLIEIGIPPAVAVPAAAIASALPPPSSIPVPGGITVTSLALTLGSGSATVLVGASVAISLGIFGTTVLPFTYRLTFTVTPSFSMHDMTEVCLVTAAGPATLATPLGGLLNLILGALAPAFEPMLTSRVVPAVQAALNRVILSTAASAVGVPALPAGVVLSLRRVVITPGGVSLFASVGSYGGLLNKITL